MQRSVRILLRKFSPTGRRDATLPLPVTFCQIHLKKGNIFLFPRFLVAFSTSATCEGGWKFNSSRKSDNDGQFDFFTNAQNWQ